MRRLSWCALAGLVLALPALPAPGPKKDDKPEPPTPGQRKKATNNLKQIGLAFHNHHDTFGWLPTNLSTKDGKPGLSWRVAILPFIEEDNLYKQFKLNEPWDSEHNKKLIERMPKLYAPIRGKADKGQTFYQMCAGKGTMLDPEGGHLQLADVTDGLSNTLMVAEAAKPVLWTKPDDMPYDGEDPPKLGGMFDGQFHAVMGDGSVHLFKKDVAPLTLHRLIERADGNVIDLDGARVPPEKEERR
jgi:Protein of unknown function (DUF1559)